MRIGIWTGGGLGAMGQRANTSGDAIVEWAGRHGYEVAVRSVVPDETDRIAGKLARWADSGEVDVILTTGGTGLTARDVTPEATEAVVERLAPGVDRRRGGRTRGARRLSRSRGRVGHRGSHDSRLPAPRSRLPVTCLTASWSRRTISSTRFARTRRSRRRASTPRWQRRSTKRARPCAA